MPKSRSVPVTDKAKDVWRKTDMSGVGRVVKSRSSGKPVKTGPFYGTMARGKSAKKAGKKA